MTTKRFVFLLSAGGAFVLSGVLLFVFVALVPRHSDAKTQSLSAQSTSAQAGAASPEALTTVAKQLLADNDDPSVPAANYVDTTRNAALAVMGAGEANDGSAGNSAVLVTMNGKFRGLHARFPPGAKIPSGTILYFILDPATGKVTDWGIGSNPVEIASLGSVQTLKLN